MRHVTYKIKRDGKGYDIVVKGYDIVVKGDDDIVVKGDDAGGRRPKNKKIKSLIYAMYKHVINT